MAKWLMVVGVAALACGVDEMPPDRPLSALAGMAATEPVEASGGTDGGQVGSSTGGAATAETGGAATQSDTGGTPELQGSGGQVPISTGGSGTGGAATGGRATGGTVVATGGTRPVTGGSRSSGASAGKAGSAGPAGSSGMAAGGESTGGLDAGGSGGAAAECPRANLPEVAYDVACNQTRAYVDVAGASRESLATALVIADAGSVSGLATRPMADGARLEFDCPVGSTKATVYYRPEVGTWMTCAGVVTRHSCSATSSSVLAPDVLLWVADDNWAYVRNAQQANSTIVQCGDHQVTDRIVAKIMGEIRIVLPYR